MGLAQNISEAEPTLSVIIPVYNDWKMLDGCLRALSLETGTALEIIVVDDGSDESCPEFIRQWCNHLPLKILEQEHKGISEARNSGIRACKGLLLLFIDADCRVQANCLSKVTTAATRFPQENYFQLRLIGDPSVLTGRAEHLRLTVLQQQSLQSDGHIRYANTAGFAVRRLTSDVHIPLFDPKAPRGEDTLLLVNLLRAGEIPLFTPEAAVQHLVPRSLFKCFRKDISSGYLQSPAYAVIDATGIRIRMSNRARFRMIISLWYAAKSYSGGKAAWLVLLARQLLERATLFLCRWLGIVPKIRDVSHPNPAI
ncbi:MAG TPA: glycosyltransferase family 2 protein [Terriglobales bacterium]|nr:glycosyltransferase family 2 protein [Terriglobales bacterium]